MLFNSISNIFKKKEGLRGYFFENFEELKMRTDQIFEAGVTIVIPVYNALDELKECINSVYRNMDFRFRIVIVNDCSTDKNVDSYLKSIENREEIMIIQNTKNRGFVYSVNCGVKSTNGDVVILNSDTVVTPGWLQKLVIAISSDSRNMTATPFSNAAGVFSVPHRDAINEFPPGYELDDMAKLVEKQSLRLYEKVPTGNGFCMYVRRAAFDAVGYFDEEAFGFGYCEENDFCMRLLDRGYYNIICDDTYIFHKRSVSFSDKKKQLLENNMRILKSRYPQYGKLVKRMLRTQEGKIARMRIASAIERYKKPEAMEECYLVTGMTGLADFNHNNWSVMEGTDLSIKKIFVVMNEYELFRLEENQLIKVRDYKNEFCGLSHDNQLESLYFNILYHYHIDKVVMLQENNLIDMVSQWLGIRVIKI